MILMFIGLNGKKKASLKGFIWYNSISIKFSKYQNYRNGEQITGFQKPEMLVKGRPVGKEGAGDNHKVVEQGRSLW